MKTVLIALTLAGVGFTVVNPECRQYVLSNPWACLLFVPAYACGFWRMFLHVASTFVRRPLSIQTEPDGLDIIVGLCAGLVWPVVWCGNLLFRGLSKLIADYVNKPVVDYAKKTVDKIP